MAVKHVTGDDEGIDVPLYDDLFEPLKCGARARERIHARFDRYANRPCAELGSFALSPLQPTPGH